MSLIVCILFQVYQQLSSRNHYWYNYTESTHSLKYTFHFYKTEPKKESSYHTRFVACCIFTNSNALIHFYTIYVVDNVFFQLSETSVMKCWWKFLSQTIFLHFRTSNLDKYKRKGKSIWLMEKMKKHPVYANIPSSRHLDHNVYFNRCKVNEKKNIVFLLVIFQSF